MWERLREQRSQKEREGTGALPPRPESGPPSTARSQSASWPTSPPASPAGEGLPDDAKRTLRAALEAFREQQDAARPGRAAPAEAEEDLGPDDGAPAPPPRGKKEIDEALEYLGDALENYGRFVMNIGENGFTAPMVLYYRDEVQDLLDELMAASVDLQDQWLRTVELDDEVRRRAQDLVDEIGWGNFKQYQIINDPPPKNWWWFLNRQTKAPPPPPPFWQFWKHQDPAPQAHATPQSPEAWPPQQG